jgi:magnesium transporter
MNFEFMPELKWKYGYFFALLLMLGMLAATFLGFRSKGWLGGPIWANDPSNRNRNS